MERLVEDHFVIRVIGVIRGRPFRPVAVAAPWHRDSAGAKEFDWRVGVHDKEC